MIDLVYIASPSYSGSTLLTFLLNAHPQIATMGELKWGPIDIATYECSCGALLSKCSFWQAVTQRVHADGLPFDLERPATDFRCRDNPVADRIVRARLRGPLFEQVRDGLVATMPACRRTFPQITQVNRSVIEAILELQGGRVFADSSKDPVRLKYLLESEDYNVWVIQLIRDGRGVLNSAVRRNSTDPEVATREWLSTHQQIEQLASRIGSEKLMSLRYEDLCADPPETLRRIHGFLGITPTIPDDFSSVAHHILGNNNMRLGAAGSIRLDETWRTELASPAQAIFERIAGATNRRYGYE